MARIAMNPKARLELRGRMFAELAQYVYPKRKAIQISGTVELGEVTQRLSAGRGAHGSRADRRKPEASIRR